MLLFLLLFMLRRFWRRSCGLWHCMGVWTVWTLRAADVAKLRAFETTCFRRVLGISWSEHKTNEFVLAQMGTARELVSTVRNRSCSISDTLSGPRTSALIYSREESTARETEVVQEDADWTTSRTGRGGHWRSVETGISGERRCEFPWSPTLSNEDGIRQGKVRFL